MKKTVPKKMVLFYSSHRREDEVILSKFERGPISALGMLAMADDPEAYAIELERQRKRLNPKELEEAEQLLADWRFAASARAPVAG